MDLSTSSSQSDPVDAPEPRYSTAGTVLLGLLLVGVTVLGRLAVSSKVALLERPVFTTIRVQELGLAAVAVNGRDPWARVRAWSWDSAEVTIQDAVRAYEQALQVK